MEPLVRKWQPGGDSLQELTDLINRAYKALADQGMRYVGTHQGPETTAQRIAGGLTWVALDGSRLIGTVTVYPPGSMSGCPYYRDEAPAVFGQFAVCPNHQKKRIGSQLLNRAEGSARQWGATLLACDTSEQALGLIEMYQKWGFAVVGEADWRPAVNYKSVILAREIKPPGPK